MKGCEAEFPVWARWENPGLIKKITGGVAALFGLNRGGRNFPVFPDDTFLVSYPRSGNTWTRFLIANFIYEDDPVTFANIEDRIPDPVAVSRRRLAKLRRPRIVKSHEYFHPLYRKVIYIVRDPRDVAVSNYYFQLKKRFIPNGFPMDQYVSRFVIGGIDMYASWGENVSSWLATRGRRGDFLLLKYEEMTEQPERELSKVASFLGMEATPERLTRAVELSSADRMRELERAEANVWAATKKTRKDIPFVRGAMVGGWSSALSEEQVSQIESAWGPLMEVLGYELVTQPRTDDSKAALWTTLLGAKR